MTHETSRLILRRWKTSDQGELFALNSDPEVMRYMPAALTRQQSDAMIERIESHFERYGYGLWAVDAKDGTGPKGNAFIGLVGLLQPNWKAHFTPCVEVAYRLARTAWGFGYATEAASKALEIGFYEHDFTRALSQGTLSDDMCFIA